MDHVRVGRQVRALRRRRGWRQIDVAVAAGTSRQTISRVEVGAPGNVSLNVLERIAQVLGARLDVRLSWNGEALDRLLDAGHAAIVELVAAELRALGWEVAVEVSFNIRGERGSIDILAFHPDEGIVLVVEVKSTVPDLQAMIMGIDRKVRLAVTIARERGWNARGAARLLVGPNTRTARRRVTEHRETFAAAFPARNVEVRRWLRKPTADAAFSGLWFVPVARTEGARHRVHRSDARVRPGASRGRA